MTGSLTSSLQNEKASGEHLENASEYDFGGESQLLRPLVLSEEDERKLWRKIDLRLMPILCVMYLMSFMDRDDVLYLRKSFIDTIHEHSRLTSLIVYLSAPPSITVCAPFVGEVVWGVVMTLMELVKTLQRVSDNTKIQISTALDLNLSETYIGRVPLKDVYAGTKDLYSGASIWSIFERPAKCGRVKNHNKIQRGRSDRVICSSRITPCSLRRRVNRDKGQWELDKEELFNVAAASV
ncbi:hypothetical protein EV359DRAFT_66717 [Lentinula novae-zelandiae]|nr:hypothetical protein EV359DRAFT_66717 [Lentinula novae-zelandiae]